MAPSPAGGESDGGSHAGGATNGEPPGEPSNSHLPCAIESLLRARCQSCHAQKTPSGVALLTYADLLELSPADPHATVAARCLQRMKDASAGMPPSPLAPASPQEITTLQAWLDDGAPQGTCSSTETPEDPYAAAPVCSSGSYWTGSDSGSPWMMPGHACITCHRQYPAYAPRFTVAGTVFATAHEPDKCFGVPLSANVQVVLTDANGQELSPIQARSGGNFGAILAGLALPYRAKVVVAGRERVMLTPQTNGDCNACHTQSGLEGARGRIIPP